ncbi:MAG: hypothetical protein AAF366_02820 [Pseudomonadota bacterium]
MADAVDPTRLIFSGIVCTNLAALMPPTFPIWVRSATGGIGAVVALPFIRLTLQV